MKPTLAVDIDGVIAQIGYHFLLHYEYMFDEHLRFEDLNDTTISKSVGDEEKVTAVFNQMAERGVYEQLPIYPTVVDALGRLSQDVNIHLLTHRDPKLAIQTERWLRAKELGHLPVSYDQAWYLSKGFVAAQMGAIGLVDDYTHNVESAVEHGVHGFLHDARYNRNHWCRNEVRPENTEQEIPSEITRIRSWGQLEDIVQEMVK